MNVLLIALISVGAASALCSIIAMIQAYYESTKPIKRLDPNSPEALWEKHLNPVSHKLCSPEYARAAFLVYNAFQKEASALRKKKATQPKKFSKEDENRLDYCERQEDGFGRLIYLSSEAMRTELDSGDGI